MLNCSKEIIKYHNEKVTLNQSMQNRMRELRDANRNRIKKTLHNANKPNYLEMISQGSYAMHTMIQSEKNDFDIDDGIYFSRSELKDSNDNDMSIGKIKNMICDAVTTHTLSEPPKIKTNCIRVQYAEGYHVDIPIYRVDGNKIELASADGWKVSDARAVTNWFNEAIKKSPDETNGRQMRRIVRLLKTIIKNDTSLSKIKSPSGFVISILVNECYAPEYNRDDLSLYNTMMNIKNRLSFNQQVMNPVLTSLPLIEYPYHATIGFYHKLDSVLNDLQVLNTTKDAEEALKAWGKIFKEKEYFQQFVDENKNRGIWESNSNNTSPVEKSGGGRFA